MKMKRDKYSYSRDEIPTIIYPFVGVILFVCLCHIVSDYTGGGVLVLFFYSLHLLYKEKRSVNFYRYAFTRIYVFTYSVSSVLSLFIRHSADVSFEIFLLFYLSAFIFSSYVIYKSVSIISNYKKINKRKKLSGFDEKSPSIFQISFMLLIFILVLLSPLYIYTFFVDFLLPLHVPEGRHYVRLVGIFGDFYASSSLFMVSMSLYLIMLPLLSLLFNMVRRMVCSKESSK